MLGVDRRGRVDDQHRQRVPDHRPDAEDVPREAEVNEHLIQFSYFIAAVLFILSLRWLNHPRTARRGVAAGVGGHGGGDRRHAAGAGDRRLQVDRRGAGGRHARSASRCRGWRSRRCRSGRRCRTPSAASPRAWSAPRSTSSGCEHGAADDVPRLGDRRSKSSSAS